MKKLQLLICAYILSLFAHVSYGSTIIDTTNAASPWASVGNWGEVGSATIGQTFTVGSDNRLDNFTLWVSATISGQYTDQLEFGAYVMKWNGNKATGPILFDSGRIGTTGNIVRQGFEPVTADTGGLYLDTGSQYVAFFSVTNYIAGSPSTGWAAYVGEAFSGNGGAFVYIDNGSDSSAWTTNSWTTWHTEGDLAYTMSFNIPEPLTLLLLGLGGLLLRRKQ